MKPTTRETENRIRDLYERYASMVFRRCRMFLKTEDDAWDATQEVFMKLLRSIDSIKKIDSVYSWLLSTSTNYCISALRKRRHELFNEELHGVDDSSALPQERRMLLADLYRHFLAPWDERTRQIVIYTYFDGYRQDEIARLTGMGESTIRRHLTRFRRVSSSQPFKRSDLS